MASRQKIASEIPGDDACMIMLETVIHLLTKT